MNVVAFITSLQDLKHFHCNLFRKYFCSIPSAVYRNLLQNLAFVARSGNKLTTSSFMYLYLDESAQKDMSDGEKEINTDA